MTPARASKRSRAPTLKAKAAAALAAMPPPKKRRREELDSEETGDLSDLSVDGAPSEDEMAPAAAATKDSQDLDHAQHLVPRTPSLKRFGGPRPPASSLALFGGRPTPSTPSVRLILRGVTAPPLLISSSPPDEQSHRQLPSFQPTQSQAQTQRAPSSSPPPTPPKLEYESQWALVVTNSKGKEEEIGGTYQRFKGRDRIYSKIQDWSRKKAASAGVITTLIKGEAYHKGLRTQRDRPTWDLEDEDDFDKAITHLKEWCTEGKVDIHFNLKVLSLAPARPAPAPASSRVTAIERHTERRVAALADLSDNAREEVDLIKRWMCTLSSCKNHGSACWWHVNAAESHFPFNNAVQVAWGRDISNGKTDVDTPTVPVVLQLTAARDGYKRKKGRASPPAVPIVAAPVAAQPIIVNYPPQPPQPPPPVYYQHQYSYPPHPPPPLPPQIERTLAYEPASSPPTETSPTDRIIEFFQWLRGPVCNKRWRQEAADLRDIELAIKTSGWDLRGLVVISIEEWRLLGLKSGQRPRLVADIKRFRTHLRERDGVSPDL